jgi:hypothetical protein
VPRRARGRQTASAEACYQAELQRFCARLREIRSRLDFEVGARGWCYLLETERIIDKDEFDDAERLISKCRKIVATIDTAHLYYTPEGFWEDLDHYVEIAVEKADLKSLFVQVAEEFHVVIQRNPAAPLGRGAADRQGASVMAPRRRREGATLPYGLSAVTELARPDSSGRQAKEDICAEDEKRALDGIEYLNEPDPEVEARRQSPS